MAGDAAPAHNNIFGRDRVWSMRRGGIHAARKTVRALVVAGSVWRLPCNVGRAFTPAEPVIMCGGVKTPPYKPGETGKFPINLA